MVADKPSKSSDYQALYNDYEKLKLWFLFLGIVCSLLICAVCFTLWATADAYKKDYQEVLDCREYFRSVNVSALSEFTNLVPKIYLPQSS